MLQQNDRFPHIRDCDIPTQALIRLAGLYRCSVDDLPRLTDIPEPYP